MKNFGLFRLVNVRMKKNKKLKVNLKLKVNTSVHFIKLSFDLMNNPHAMAIHN